MVLLLQSGRCYEAEICTILLPLRCSFRWTPCLPKQYYLVVATAVAVCCRIHSATVLSWYTVASGMAAVVVRVAIVLLSGCNSSCSQLQTIDYSQEFCPKCAHCLGSFYSSLEGAMKLKVSPPAPLQLLFYTFENLTEILYILTPVCIVKTIPSFAF